MANIALFRLFNRDLFGNFNELYRTITRTPGPVVLHFHVLHSYWLNLKSVVRFCEKVKNHKPDVTLVWTLHDHWMTPAPVAAHAGGDLTPHLPPRLPPIAH